MVATWCHRNLAPQERLSDAEQRNLTELYRLYHLPFVISLAEYEAIARTLPLQDLRTADWSGAVAPFWDDVVFSALNPQVLWGIVSAGWKTVEGAFAIPLMQDGYRTGLIRYGILAGVKS
jgi:tocopherol O-methyltransferase